MISIDIIIISNIISCLLFISTLLILLLLQLTLLILLLLLLILLLILLLSLLLLSSLLLADKGPYALMLSPTRELAQQIAAVMEEAGASSGLKTLCAYGGVPKPPQVWVTVEGLGFSAIPVHLRCCSQAPTSMVTV